MAFRLRSRLSRCDASEDESGRYKISLETKAISFVCDLKDER